MASNESTLLKTEDKLNPERAWEKLKVKINVKQLAPMSVDTPVSNEKVRLTLN
jgi:hypothetical protein